MSVSDPVADMLTRIRNAQAVRHKKIELPASTVKAAILSVLKKEGYIESFEEVSASEKNSVKKNLSVVLKYFQGRPVIEKIKRISTPGLRVYKNSKDMPGICNGAGITIVTTPKGIMTAKDAHAGNIGGEVLCTVE
jgi:small subunit ribosomal protein S8